MKSKIEKMFGEFVCSDEVLKKYMNKSSYKSYITIKNNGDKLDTKTAKEIAKAIKTWALKMGATHYSHWFMPLNNKTAEKQVSFIEIDSEGKYIEDFSEKVLIKGETDASSFPNGGERMTFEARGYTVWDYTSPVFLKEDSAKNKVIYIPTAFCSYNGSALDEKTPLLRAVESLNKNALRVLKHLGYDDVKNINFHVGAEQEYFLINTSDYEKRLDLKMTGRTLFGAKPLKSQEQYSHYFGMIEDRVSEFMNEVDSKLWKMGITAKLQHNEVAPCQHEFVPIFNNVNVASDQNQIIMETLTSTAKKYGFTILFHEKPFNCVNGSGKHENWSISTDTGINLFDIKLKDKTLFYTFFVAMIAAIDKFYKLIRLSTAYRENDLRLGGDEAPPALVSVFVSDYVLNMLKNMDTNHENKKSFVNTGVKILPNTEKDFCDRNRTSPFAFTGNKFEFRMVGSSQTVAWPSTCMATTLSYTLKELADEMDKGLSKNEIISLLNEYLTKHERIIFNGNSYSEEWKEEASKRGIIEYRNSASIYEILEHEDIIQLFKTTEVLDKNELSMRKSTSEKRYIETVLLEGKTMYEMLNKEIYPALNNYLNHLLSLEFNNIQKKEISKLIEIKLNNLYNLGKNLIKNIENINIFSKNNEKCAYVEKEILSLIKEIREEYDSIENFIPDNFEPFPTYNDILF